MPINYVARLKALAKTEEGRDFVRKHFPELAPSYFEFEVGEQHYIPTIPLNNFPVFIGKGLAPASLAEKCLIVNDGFIAEIRQDRGQQVIVFKYK